jgi:hypothetical protein
MLMRPSRSIDGTLSMFFAVSCRVPMTGPLSVAVFERLASFSMSGLKATGPHSGIIQ